MILMIDNYDSFTYNLVHYFRELEQTVNIFRNNEITLAEIKKLNPKGIVISPGPCTPNESGISLAVIQNFATSIPILGVCLGHQAIAQVFGGKVIRAEKVMHGKTSLIYHHQQGIFNNLKNPFIATRYHSLIVEKASLPKELMVTAWYPHASPPPQVGEGKFESPPQMEEEKFKALKQTEEEKFIESSSAIIMGLQHRELPIFGVQFHPEAILTEEGHHLLQNFIEVCDH